MAEDLNPADRSSLAAEVGSVNMAVGGVMLFDSGPGLRHERVLERIESRLHLVPRYRQRLRHAAPGVTNPVWVDDDHFDLTWHVRRAALHGSGGEEELAEFVGTEMSRKLDRSRPLWELTVVEGVRFGRTAIVWKMHHALVDGIAAVDLGVMLLDPTPEPLEIPGPDAPWEPRPYDRSRHLRRLGLSPAVRARDLLLDSAQRALRPDAPLRAAGDLLKATELLAELARTKPAAPMTPLNKPIGPNRRYALARVKLSDVKAAGKAAGGTVNDTLLAVVAGMLRRYLEAAGGTPSRPPVALVPVSVRKEGEEGGNRISTVLVDLPTDPDPVAAIQAINASMARIKDSAAVRAGALMVGAAGWAPPIVSGTLARAMSGVRAFNLVVSNVPGPQQPFYLNGARLQAVHPVVPLNPSTQGLNVGIVSYDGWVCFGVLADRDLDPPLTVARTALQQALDEVLAVSATS